MDRSLEYIMEVAKTGSIARASRQLYVTPSALSRFIQNKEKELGTPLFDRVGKQFVLTHAGEVYVKWGRQIAQMQEAMEQEIEMIARARTGRICLGFPMILARTLTGEIIPRYMREFPDVEIILEERTSVELEHLLEENLVDFAIMTVTERQENLIYHPLSDDQLVLAVPWDHPLAAQAVRREGMRYPWIDLRKAAGETFIVLYPEQTLGKYAEMVFKKYHITPKRPIQVHTVDTSLRCVMNGLGITFTYDRPVFEEDYKGKVVPLCFEQEAVKRELCLVNHKDHELTPLMLSLMNVCRRYYQETDVFAKKMIKK